MLVIWALVVVGLVAVVFSAGYVFNENLYAYGLCAAARWNCTNGPWLSSMGLSFFGSIAMVGAGAFLGLRRYGNGRTGMWFPLAGLGAVAALTGLSIVILKVTTPL